MLMGYSKNQKPAKEFLHWISSKSVFGTWFASQQGFCRRDQGLGEGPDVGGRPDHVPFKDVGQISARYAGHAGPSNRAAAEAVTKYIITDMYAKAIQGMAPEGSVKWAHSELVKIYGS